MGEDRERRSLVQMITCVMCGQVLRVERDQHDHAPNAVLCPSCGRENRVPPPAEERRD